MGAVLLFTLLSIPLYVLAWQQAARGRYGWALTLLLLGGLLLRMGPLFDPLLHPWDERYHALVAKNLMAHPLRPTLYEHPVLPYVPDSWTGGHVWLHKPPLTLWLMAGSMKVFGVSEAAVRVPSLVLTTLGIWICFATVAALWGRRTGFVAAFLFAIQGAVIEFGSGRVATDHVDTLLAICISAAVLFCLKYRERRSPVFLVLSGAMLGAAVLTKWWIGLMAVPAQWLFLLHGNRRRWPRATADTALMLGVALLVCLPWMLYLHATYPAIQQAMERSALERMRTVMDGQGGGPLYYVDRLRIRYGDLVYLPCLWYVCGLLREHPGIDRWALACWFLLPYLVFSCFSTKMQGYVLGCTVPILAITALYWTTLERRSRPGARHRWLRIAVLAALLGLPVRYTLERLKPFEDQRAQAALKQRILALPITASPDSTVVIGPYPIETMFHTGCTAYEAIAPGEREQLVNAGYRLVLADREP